MQQNSFNEKILCFFFQNKNIFRVFILSEKLGSRRKSYRQTLTKYFVIFPSFSVVSPHHKHNRTRSLSSQTEYIHVVSRIAKRLRDVWENLTIECTHSVVLSLQKKKFGTSSRKFNKSHSTLHESHILLDFINKSQSIQ